MTRDTASLTEIVSKGFHPQVALAPRVLVVGIILVITVPVRLSLSTHRVSHIRVKFLDKPSDFDMDALVYLIYELNKRQKNWFFEVDFDVFNKDVLTSQQRKTCDSEPSKAFCYAEIIAQGTPFIGFTSQQLGDDSFWQNRDKVSVISTAKWKHYAPPSVYEFLVFSTITQSLVIHLNTHCTGLPQGSFEARRVASGDLFQYSPCRTEMKAVILTGHLSRTGEELLLNCFGVEYMTIVAKLLTLNWLHTKKVTGNLKKAFEIHDVKTGR